MNDVVDLGGETPAAAGNVGAILAFVSKLRTEQTVAATSAGQLGRANHRCESAIEVLVTDADRDAAAGGEAEFETLAHAAVLILRDFVVAHKAAASLFQKKSTGRDEEAAGAERLVEFRGEEVSAPEDDVVAQFTAQS